MYSALMAHIFLGRMIWKIYKYYYNMLLYVNVIIGMTGHIGAFFLHNLLGIYENKIFIDFLSV